MIKAHSTHILYPLKIRRSNHFFCFAYPPAINLTEEMTSTALLTDVILHGSSPVLAETLAHKQTLHCQLRWRRTVMWHSIFNLSCELHGAICCSLQWRHGLGIIYFLRRKPRSQSLSLHFPCQFLLFFCWGMWGAQISPCTVCVNIKMC